MEVTSLVSLPSGIASQRRVMEWSPMYTSGMRTVLLLLVSLLWLSNAHADNNFILFSRGAGKPAIYIPGYRTYSTGAYQPSARNVALLKEIGEGLPAIRIAGFTSQIPGGASVACRLSFPIYLPGQMPREAYLAQAMRTELAEANLYAVDAGTVLSGNVTAWDFSSFGTGKWIIEAAFSIEGKTPITIRQEYSFPVALSAVKGCEDVSRELVPAMQEFLLAVYSNPKFKELLQWAPDIDVLQTEFNERAAELP
jgi:hypothetical protein